MAENCQLFPPVRKNVYQIAIGASNTFGDLTKLGIVPGSILASKRRRMAYILHDHLSPPGASQASSSFASGFGGEILWIQVRLLAGGSIFVGEDPPWDELDARGLLPSKTFGPTKLENIAASANSSSASGMAVGRALCSCQNLQYALMKSKESAFTFIVLQGQQDFWHGSLAVRYGVMQPH